MPVFRKNTFRPELVSIDRDDLGAQLAPLWMYLNCNFFFKTYSKIKQKKNENKREKWKMIRLTLILCVCAIRLCAFLGPNIYDDRQ